MNSVFSNSLTSCGTFSGAVTPHLTPSGTTQGAGSTPHHSIEMLPARFHRVPMWWPPFPLPTFQVTFPTSQSLMMQESTYPVIPGSSLVNDNPTDHVISHERDDTSDELALQDPKQVFDRSIKMLGAWDPPTQMYAFLEKYFNHNLSETGRSNCPRLPET